MTSASVPHWLLLFCDGLSCGPAFRRSLDAALCDAFTARTGTRLDGFMLVPPDRGAADIAVHATGVANVSTDLVGPNAEGYPVTVAWQAVGVTRPLPADPAVEAAAAAGSLRAWWAALPEDEIRRAFGAVDRPPWPTSPRFPFNASDFSFAVEWRPLPWPDVWLQVRLSRGAAAAALPVIVPRLCAVQESWNRGDDGDPAYGLIHQLGSRAAVLANDVIVVNVDFGSAGPAALVAMLRALDEAADGVSVARVIVGSALLAEVPTA